MIRLRRKINFSAALAAFSANDNSGYEELRLKFLSISL